MGRSHFPCRFIWFIHTTPISLTAPATGGVMDRQGARSADLLQHRADRRLPGDASVQTVYALYALLLIDNVLFSFRTGFTIYLHRIVRPNELTPCLAMGTNLAAMLAPPSRRAGWRLLLQTCLRWPVPSCLSFPTPHSASIWGRRPVVDPS